MSQPRSFSTIFKSNSNNTFQIQPKPAAAEATISKTTQGRSKVASAQVYQGYPGNSPVPAIQTLESINEQFISFVFPSSESKSSSELINNNENNKNNCNSSNNNGKYPEEIAFKAAVVLMRRLLLDTQSKFRKMVEENKALGGRLDGDLQSAHHQMALLRAELTDTNKRLSLLGTPPSTPSTPSHGHGVGAAASAGTGPTGTSETVLSATGPTAAIMNGHGVYSTGNNSNSSNNGSLRSHHDDFEEPSSTSSLAIGINTNSHYLDLDTLTMPELKKECERLVGLNQTLQIQLKELKRNSRNGGTESRASSINSNSGATSLLLSGGGGQASSATETEQLQHAKEALSALKADRKRLKAEKFELLNQMKQLYVTLEDKEKELRDFIRNYEQRMRESETSIQRLAVERDEAERERWSILRHARDEAERGLQLATQLNLREAQVQQLQEELHEARRQLSQHGIYAEPDNRSTTNTNNSHYSLVSSLTATYGTTGDRGSSADSGVRLSSDRDSGGGLQTAGTLSDSTNEAISLDLCGDGSGGDGDSVSVISTATLPQLFATPRDSPGPINFSSLTRSLAEANVLSKSAEQLLAAEAIEARRHGHGGLIGNSSKTGRRSGEYSSSARTSTGAKGAWGSISRVFARNKHRRTLDPSIYDNLKPGSSQRSSWSPQNSPVSPLAEQESYGDKLRALEEAATLPMELWRANMVQAWVEVSLGMPQYGSRCGDNIKSGKVLLELSDADLEAELGIGHPMHRKKLRLAIEEHRNPTLVRFPCIVELSHVWVASEWLPDIGLPQYVDSFAGCLVDARLLDHLGKKDLEKYLGVTRKFHLASIAHGVHLLRMTAYDRQALAERRRQCENDPLVWTNQRFIQWARSIDLNEYADNLKGSGVHGAFAVLETTFNGDTLASAMGIPPNKQIIRRHLSAELDALLNPARAKITQQYRVTTKSRLSTLEKQRSDSLGRNITLSSFTGGGSNDSFRRSTGSAEENRRRTSLRSSLSRALGIKLKQDLAQQRREQEDKKSSIVRPTDFSTFLGYSKTGGNSSSAAAGASSTGFNSSSSPYLPSPSSSSQYSDKVYFADYQNGSQSLLNGILNDCTSSPFHYSSRDYNTSSPIEKSNQFQSHQQQLPQQQSSHSSSSRPQSITSIPSTSTTTSTIHNDNDGQKILETEIIDDDEIEEEATSAVKSNGSGVGVDSGSSDSIHIKGHYHNNSQNSDRPIESLKIEESSAAGITAISPNQKSVHTPV